MKERLQEGSGIRLFFGLLTAYPLSVENVILISIHEEDHYVRVANKSVTYTMLTKTCALSDDTLFRNINKYLSNYLLCLLE